MNYPQFTFKVVRKLYRYFRWKFDYLTTWFLFKIFRIKSNSFSTTGIPIIDVGDNYGDKIIIGKNLKMNNRLAFNHIGFSSPCVFIAKGGTINIGDNCGISQSTLISLGASIKIGNNTLLGGGVKVYTTDFHSLDYRDRRNIHYDKNGMISKSIFIGDDCFIGAGTIILKGVNIGNRSIIGANSLVSKDIPSDCIAAGNPCKVIKRIN